jgi:DNA-binding transcriptional ArsR family regulator
MVGPPDPRLATALRTAGVPVRLAILRAIDSRDALSPSGYARTDDDTTLREAAYHFRALRDAELIVLDELRVEGGAAEHRYVLSPLAQALVRALPRLEQAA